MRSLPDIERGIEAAGAGPDPVGSAQALLALGEEVLEHWIVARGDVEQEELEKLLLAAPAETWPEAAAKAQYLIQLFAATPEAQDPQRKELIAHALDDLKRLCDRLEES